MVEVTTIEENTPESWKTIVLTYMFWQVSQYFLRSLDRWLSVVVCSCSGEHQEGQWLVAFVFYQKNSCSTAILLSFGQFRMPHQEPKARLSSYSFDQELKSCSFSAQFCRLLVMRVGLFQLDSQIPNVQTLSYVKDKIQMLHCQLCRLRSFVNVTS